MDDQGGSESEDKVGPLLSSMPKRKKTKSDLSSIQDGPMMGSLVRRRRVVSMPLGDRSFFTPLGTGLAPVIDGEEGDALLLEDRKKQKQPSFPPRRDVMDRIMRRKQVSLDLLSPQQAEFFGAIQDAGELEEVEEEKEMPKLFFPLRFAPRLVSKAREDEEERVAPGAEVQVPPIVKATRFDKIKALVLAAIFIVLVGVCVGWKTHDDESHSLFGVVGIACVTDCKGDTKVRNFFNGHEDQFNSGDVIGLTMHLDPIHQEEDIFEKAKVEITRIDDSDSNNQTVVETIYFGPPDKHYRKTFTEKIKVDWTNPENHHVINVYSATGTQLSFTLAASRQTPLSQYSVLIAALIMIAVYVLILLEIIHRTLVSIFGSMVALFFYFLMHDGETESIRTVMLHQEWSTLGLLFGMMVIVGELSHTGIFEWVAVRILIMSKGSFNRLMILLCLLTAVASAFLDNVTTMLLIAPVTIDMCGILQVDPRPYLISEVILSNVGGTATLIGDPPNIIIGSSFDEVGFLDFITNIMPCIFLLAVPLSLLLLLWIYKPYIELKEMPDQDVNKLKETYPIYDEPRLFIAGTSTFFLIVLFFLHPIHHKDTAWLALITAFLTISFTNPHDVQDVLRNHVEWDTLLFFAGLFVLVEVCAAMGLLEAIGTVLADVIKAQDESRQLTIAITLILWVSAIASAFLDNIPYTATMIPIVSILADELPDTLPIKTLAWALSFGACLGGNGTLLGASANIVCAGIATNRGFKISFVNFLYPGMAVMVLTIAIANLYMLLVYVWV